MDPLVKLVWQYRRAQDLSQRIRVGEQIASAVGPRVQAWLFQDLPAAKAEQVFLRAVRWVVFLLGEFHGKTDRAFWRFCRRVVRQQITEPQVGHHQAGRTLPEQLWQTALREDDEDQIVHLVRQYQTTNDLSYRNTLAEEIVQAVSPVIAKTVPPYLSAHEREDIMQETHVGIVGGLLRFDKDTAREFRGFCCGIARHKVVDALRVRAKKQAREAAVEDPWQVIEATAQEEPLLPGERTDLKDCLERLRNLKPLCYSYLWNYYIIGLDHGEIATIHETSPDAVRMHIKRCLKLARAMVN